MRCYVFDLDGTLADLRHRLHFLHEAEKPDWRGFFAACAGDTLIEPVARLLSDLWEGGHPDSCHIVILSGRSSECAVATEEWLFRHSIPYDRLCMRREGDHRPDHTVKSEMLDTLLADGYEPIMFFDDRDQVVNMWRARGYTCLQVAPGAF